MTIGGWIIGIIRALDSAGLDGATLARQAGINPETLAAGARSPLGANTRLWRLAVQATGDPCFGLRVPAHVPATGLHGVAYAMMASANLKEALERFVRYQRSITTSAQFRLEAAGERYRLTIEPIAGQTYADEAIDACVAYTIRGCRMIYGRQLSPLGVTLTRLEPSPSAAFRKVFRCPVVFSARANTIEFAREDLDRPLVSANSELARSNDEVVVRYIARLEAPALSQRLQALLVGALPDELSQRAAARQLGMSSRHLQRRLGAEGTSYKRLLDEIRYAMGCEYLDQGTRSIGEIATLLGFSDSSAFSRAFKRWTGASPRSRTLQRAKAN